MILKPLQFRVLINSLVIAAIILAKPIPLLAYSQIPEFLCETGIKFYQQGRYEEALHEFRKALIISPGYLKAIRYIEMIEQPKPGAEALSRPAETIEEALPGYFQPASADSSGAIKEYLDLIEIQNEMLLAKKEQLALTTEKISGTAKELVLVAQEAGEDALYEMPQFIYLDQSLNNIVQPVEIEQGKTIIIRGKNIQRFLVTQPDILSLAQNGPDEMIISGEKIGYTYLHFWDDNGRWTIEFLGRPARPKGPTLAEKLRLEAERQASFKFRYNLGWSSYEEGRRLKTLNRKSYSWYHSLTLNGGTPYGNLDSRIVVRSLRTSTDLTSLTAGLRNGSWLNFKDFGLRVFDLYPAFSNLALPGNLSSLRGAMLESPAFNKKLYYTAFWGREGGGRFGNLSPGLFKIKDSFLNGLNVNLYPFKDSSFGFTVAHGYGGDRPDYLNKYAYDAIARWKLGKWNMGYELGYDSETFAHLFSGNYVQPRLNFNYEFRNISKNYLTITGQTGRRGELGGLFNLRQALTNKWNLSHRLDVYQDRLFPSPENDNRWNENYDFESNYNFDPTSTLRLGYTLQNQLGEISHFRYQSPFVGISKTFNFIKKISTYLNFRHRKNTSYANPRMDYTSDNISAGLRFNLIRDLFYFYNQRWDWVTERFSANKARPQAFDTGLDFNSQLFNSPFYGNMRFTYRNEEDAGSNFSFLSGQDYIEGFSELSFRPSPDKEAYCSARIRNVWAENPEVSKRIEANFDAGMRYTWDTGLRWESQGNIEGYVFNDLNSDGLRQRDEAPIEGIKVWLGKNKSAETDMFGYFKFTGIKGRKAYLTLDVQSMPVGCVLTVPPTQAVVISQGRTSRADFGMASRSEIYGIVFFDVNENGQFDRQDQGVEGVTLILENGRKENTDPQGRYYFSNAAVGDHSITLDINSVPLDYIPQAPLVKKIVLSENVSYVYNIPLKKIKK